MKKFLKCAAAALALAAVGLATNAKAQVSVLAEIHRTGTSTTGTYTFTSIPSNTSTDLINGKTATIVSGTRNGAGATVAALTNGVGATNADQPSANFFAGGNGNCRLLFDIGSDQFVGKINTYSWHTGDRSPQVYTVYGAPDGTSIATANLNANPPTGFTLIASVDTTATGTTPLSAASEAHGNGGQHGVTISGINATYRYIIFDTVQKAGQTATFYSELDVVSGPPPPPAAPTALTGTAPYAGVILTWTASAKTDYYNVYRSLTSGSGYTKIGTTATTTYNDSAVAANTTYYYVVTAVNSSGESPNSNEFSITPATAAVVGTGDGLTGRYYNGDDVNFTPLATTPILTQVDPVINFNANGNAAGYNAVPFDAGVPNINFTARWSGQFLSPITGPVTFTTIADDGVRLYVSDTTTPVINDALFQGPTTTNSAPINMVAGQKYTIIMDYFQGGGGDTAQLLYSYPGLNLSIIPQTQLYSTIAIAPATPTNLTAYSGVDGASVILNWTEPNNGSPTATFNVLRGATAGGPYTTLATGVTGTTYTDSTTTIGSTYYYVVTATNTYGASANSNEASVTPAAPTEVIHYDFENGPSGVDPDPITDITGHSNTGYALGGDQGFTTDAAHGKYGGIVTSAANTQYLSLPSNFDFGNQFTFFVNTKLPTVNGITTIFSSHAVNGYGGWSLYVNDNGNTSKDIVVETNTGGTTANVQVKATSAPNVFPSSDGFYHAVAAVVNRTAGLVDVYIDGTKVISAGVIGTTWPTASTQELLGVFPPTTVGGTNEYFRIAGAEFDDVRVFNGLLNASEIAALNVFTATVTGSVTLEGVNDLSAVSPFAPLGTFHVSFRDATTGTVVKAADIALTTTAGSGAGTFSVSGVPAGTYNVVIKGGKNLAVLVPNVVISGSAGTIPVVNLPAGDSNGDNSVDSTDFGTLIGAFNSDSAISGSGYDPTVDFNFDGLVDSTDFGLLIGEFNNTGAI